MTKKDIYYNYLYTVADDPTAEERVRWAPKEYVVKKFPWAKTLLNGNCKVMYYNFEDMSYTRIVSVHAPETWKTE